MFELSPRESPPCRGKTSRAIYIYKFLCVNMLDKEKVFVHFAHCVYIMAAWVDGFLFMNFISFYSLALGLRFSVGVHSDLKVYHCRFYYKMGIFINFKTIRRQTHQHAPLLPISNFFSLKLFESALKSFSLNLDSHHNDTLGCLS